MWSKVIISSLCMKMLLNHLCWCTGVETLKHENVHAISTKDVSTTSTSQMLPEGQQSVFNEEFSQMAISASSGIDEFENDHDIDPLESDYRSQSDLQCDQHYSKLSSSESDNEELDVETRL